MPASRSQALSAPAIRCSTPPSTSLIERHRDLLKRGAILVDDSDETDRPRALLLLEHAIQDARTDRAGNRRVVSKRMQLKDQELAGRVNAKLNSGLARQRADELAVRLQKRLAELEQERKLSPLPPVVLGGAMVVPVGLLRKLSGEATAVPTFAQNTERSELLAMNAVMQAERRLGYVPRDVSDQNLGYDVESSVPGSGMLRFIEVKGRVVGAKIVTITKNEILTALNKPDDFYLAICLVDGDRVDVRYVRRPFEKEPDFQATSVNYDLPALLAQAQEPA